MKKNILILIINVMGSDELLLGIANQPRGRLLISNVRDMSKKIDATDNLICYNNIIK